MRLNESYEPKFENGIFLYFTCKRPVKSCPNNYTWPIRLIFGYVMRNSKLRKKEINKEKKEKKL